LSRKAKHPANEARFFPFDPSTAFRASFFRPGRAVHVQPNLDRISADDTFPSTIALITYIQSDLYVPFRLIDDPFGAREYILSDYSTANVFAELNLRPILSEFTSPN
jgi:hypothetical protein